MEQNALRQQNVKLVNSQLVRKYQQVGIYPRFHIDLAYCWRCAHRAA
jgi:hypothetical protein